MTGTVEEPAALGGDDRPHGCPLPADAKVSALGAVSAAGRPRACVAGANLVPAPLGVTPIWMIGGLLRSSTRRGELLVNGTSVRCPAELRDAVDVNDRQRVVLVVALGAATVVGATRGVDAGPLPAPG